MAIITAADYAANRAPGRLLRRIDKTMSALVEAKFGELGLNVTHWIALKVVQDGIVSNAGELARELDITTGGVTRLIDGLEKRELMVRNRNCGDRRVVQIEVTAKGGQAVLALQRYVLSSWNEVLADFSQEEADMLIGLLLKLRSAADRVADPKNAGV